MVCECLVELAHVFVDKTFTYHVPLNLQEQIAVGKRVVVPFNTQVLEGFVLKIDKSSLVEDLKDIIEVIDPFPVLNQELLALGTYLKQTTLATLMSCYQAMLPLALKAKKKVNIAKKYASFYICAQNFPVLKNAKQKEIYDLVKASNTDGVARSCLVKILLSALNTLVKNGVLKEIKREVYRYNYSISDKIRSPLNEEQQQAFEHIKTGLDKNIVYLLYGVTGSGKTNVYLEVIEEVIKRGKQALMLVPEISLTPQILKRFAERFSNIAVLHSGLSDGEKYDEWRKIKEGKVDIVIGARSAVFAPLENLGVIIMDEEHSATYKQENSPRYHALDVAKWRAKYHNIPLILGSATPSLESFARAHKGVYQLLTLTKRYNNTLPKIVVIDLNEEFKKANSYLSNPLLEAIKDRMSKKEQSILFLNRRGYSSYLSCSGCGDVIKCPNCDISLTFHKSSNMLRCHYCGYATKKEDICPKCGAFYKEFGIGTEKIKEELEAKIPGIRVLRMDVDTTTTKNAHEKIIKDFASLNYDCLVGTQMIAKGLDFPNVTFVGVVNADISLNLPDFRASEVTFQLLNQVSGRSGRGSKQGLVYIQTFNKDHYAISYALTNDYLGFYHQEMQIRKKLAYPPFFYLCVIRIIGIDYNKTSQKAGAIAKYLKNTLNVTILGPATANPFKIKNKYRFQIILKYKNLQDVLSTVEKVFLHYFKDRDVVVEIDFNPVRL